MARVLVVHHDPGARQIILAQAADHQAVAAKDLKSAMQQIVAQPPEIIVAGQDNRDEALTLMRWMRDNSIRIPVIMFIGRTGNVFRPAALKLGVAGILESPCDRARLSAQIAEALAAARQVAAGPPPLTDEELKGNLSMLESRLNQQMKCVAGRNQVFIQSMLLGGAAATRPRICLKCPLRAEYGLPREVYYEFIRDLCCRNPGQCEAVRRFEANREIA